MDKNRGWTSDDAANDGLNAHKAEIDRLNGKSNAEQQAASSPDKAPDEAPQGSDDSA